MDLFFLRILVSLVVNIIGYLFNRLCNRKVKSHSGKSDFGFELIVKFKKYKY